MNKSVDSHNVNISKPSGRRTTFFTRPPRRFPTLQRFAVQSVALKSLTPSGCTASRPLPHLWRSIKDDAPHPLSIVLFMIMFSGPESLIITGRTQKFPVPQVTIATKRTMIHCVGSSAECMIIRGGVVLCQPGVVLYCVVL